jgi:hypothetical protein
VGEHPPAGLGVAAGGPDGGAGPAEVQQAYSWGSRASRLVQLLRAGHHDLQLSLDELDRIVTWVDLNAPITRCTTVRIRRVSEAGAH